MFMYLPHFFQVHELHTHIYTIFYYKCEREEMFFVCLWVGGLFWVVFSLVWRPWTFSWLPSRKFLLHRLIFFFMIVRLFRALNMEKNVWWKITIWCFFFFFLVLGAKNFLQSFQGFSLIYVFIAVCLGCMKKIIHRKKMKSETSEDYIFDVKREKERKNKY